MVNYTALPNSILQVVSEQVTTFARGELELELSMLIQEKSRVEEAISETQALLEKCDELGIPATVSQPEPEL
jgi:chaperonin cofactor prefoldin